MEISKNDSAYIRGICAITVLLSHIIAYSGIGNSSKIVFLIIGMMGYLPVAIFFFLSGYGLMVSYQAKGIKYIDSFLIKRVIPYYIKYLMISLLYLLIRVLLNNEIELSLLIKTVLYGGTIVKFGWYLQTQLVLYLIFFCGFKVSHIHPVRVVFLLTALFWLLCVFTGLDTTYYMTTPSFLFGVIWPTIGHKPFMRKWGGGTASSYLLQYGLLPHLLMNQSMPIYAVE